VRGVVEVSFGWDAGRQYLPLWVQLTGYQARLVRACAARRGCLRETPCGRDSWEHGTNLSSLRAGAGKHSLVHRIRHNGHLFLKFGTPDDCSCGCMVL